MWEFFSTRPDPWSEFSSRLVSNLNLLRKDSLNILENVPYAGTEDGLTRLLREKFPDASYAGIEIEVCSDLLEDNKSIRRMAVDLSQGICQSLVDL
jgi:predicted N-formylglutamate amidohydrolase